MPTKQRGTPKRSKPKARARVRSTALVRQAPAVPVVQAEPVPERILTEGTHLGELGLVEIKFTAAEEKVLSEPVPVDRIRIKPDGAIYLPHADYTRWFNRAFGRGGWTLIPVGVPTLANKTVVCPYVLYIHGKPAAFAQGEQDYYESNRNQSYGDALESTVASALRRCAKRLGIGLELWDREFADDWRRREAVRVQVRPPEGRPKKQWRRKGDPPLPWEAGQAPADDYDDQGPPADQPQQRAAPRPEPSAGHHAHAGETITAPQRRRLVQITVNSGRDEQEVVAWLARAYQWKGTADVTRAEYDRICRAIEATGPLPQGKAR